MWVGHSHAFSFVQIEQYFLRGFGTLGLEVDRLMIRGSVSNTMFVPGIDFSKISYGATSWATGAFLSSGMADGHNSLLHLD